MFLASIHFGAHDLIKLIGCLTFILYISSIYVIALSCDRMVATDLIDCYLYILLLPKLLSFISLEGFLYFNLNCCNYVLTSCSFIWIHVIYDAFHLTMWCGHCEAEAQFKSMESVPKEAQEFYGNLVLEGIVKAE